MALAESSVSVVEDSNMQRRKLSPVQVELLIEEVRQRPVLYDSKSIDHKDAQKVISAWNSIHDAMARQFGGGVKQAHDGLYWKKKWRNLRDLYVKKRRKIRSSSCQEAERAKSWSFLEIMTFLDGYIEESSMDSSVPAASDTDEMSNTQSEGEINSTVTSIYSSYSSSGQLNTASSSHTPVTSTTCHRGPMKRKYENTTTEPALANATTINDNMHRQVMCFHQRDADDLFYDSCALRCKNLPATTRSYLQLQVSQLFFNAENPLMAQVQITPLPPPEPTPHPYVQVEGSNEQYMLFEQKPEL